MANEAIAVLIQVNYMTQLRNALGIDTETVTVPEHATVDELLDYLCDLHGDSFRRMIVNKSGEKSSCLLVCIGGECVGRDLSAKLKEGDDVSLLIPISGG